MNIYDVANTMKLQRKTIFDLEIRVTFYARVSTLSEEQENSIENQIEHFQDMINNNPNWTYVEGYVDKIRGESADNRVNFLRMIEDGKSDKFDLVLTKEVSRFARNTIDSLTYTRDLLRAGVGVFFQNDNICTIDTDSELRLTIMSSIAADEVRKLSERVKFGHQLAIKKGNVLGNNRIFGYEKKDCKLSINEEEAEMVRLIFTLYATGDYSTRKIERELYAKGYKGRNGNRIHHNTITGIIRNPKYKGYYCGNKVKIVDYRTKEQRFLPEDEWVVFKDETGDIVPAIVSEEIWDRCNELMKERSEIIKSREHSIKDKSVFTGKIWCKSHDAPYWRTSYSNSSTKGQSVYQWICSEKKKHGTKSCASVAIMENDLYTILSTYFKNITENLEDYIQTFLKIYKETNIDTSSRKQISTLKSRLEKEKAKREKLLDAYTEDIISKSEFKERNDKYNVLISQLEEDIFSLEAETEKKNDYVEDLKNIENYLKNMYSPTGEMSKIEVDEMSKTLIDRIDVIPINNTTMKLEIKLKTGASDSVKYVRNGSRYGRRSEHIFLMICPEQQMKFTRPNMTMKNHLSNLVILVQVGI